MLKSVVEEAPADGPAGNRLIQPPGSFHEERLYGRGR
jgi:hypothetical protein